MLYSLRHHRHRVHRPSHVPQPRCPSAIVTTTTPPHPSPHSSPRARRRLMARHPLKRHQRCTSRLPSRYQGSNPYPRNITALSTILSKHSHFHFLTAHIRGILPCGCRHSLHSFFAYITPFELSHTHTHTHTPKCFDFALLPICIMTTLCISIFLMIHLRTSSH